MASVIDKQQQIMDDIEAELLRNVKSIQTDIYEAVEKLLKKFDSSGGRFTGDEKAVALINQLKKDIKKIVASSDFSTSVDEYLHSFDDIESNIMLIQKQVNNIVVPKTLISPYKKVMIDDVTENLLGAGMDSNFINPIKKSLFSHVNLGSTVLDTEKQLRIMISGDGEKAGLLERHVGQVARDGMQQYEGTVNQKIITELDLDAIMYVGSLVKDSRPQCRKWVGIGKIPIKDLKKQIEWALKNGKGFIKATTPETFCINRGGYNCRHTAIPTRL